MKKLLLASLITAGLGLFTTSLQAQDTTTAGQDAGNAVKKTGKAIGKGAKAVGRKTAELASKGKSAVIDKVYEGKQGPDGQVIYINNESKYYWVDKKGHHHFVTEAQLKDKN